MGLPVCANLGCAGCQTVRGSSMRDGFFQLPHCVLSGLQKRKPEPSVAQVAYIEALRFIRSWPRVLAAGCRQLRPKVAWHPWRRGF
jgi:hypothetical protein